MRSALATYYCSGSAKGPSRQDWTARPLPGAVCDP